MRKSFRELMKIFKDSFKEKHFKSNNIMALENWGEVFQTLEKPLHKLEEKLRMMIFNCIFCFIHKKKYSFEGFSQKLKKKINKSKLKDFCKEYYNAEEMPVFFEENSILLQETHIYNGIPVEGILLPPKNVTK